MFNTLKVNRTFPDSRLNEVVNVRFNLRDMYILDEFLSQFYDIEVSRSAYIRNLIEQDILKHLTNNDIYIPSVSLNTELNDDIF